MLGDPSKAAEKIGWRPQTRFKQLVEIMVDHDMEDAARDATLKKAGFRIAGEEQE